MATRSESTRAERDEKTVTFDRVLMAAAKAIRASRRRSYPGHRHADVIGPIKGPKVDTVKYKRRKGYHKKIGHRQPYSA